MYHLFKIFRQYNLPGINLSEIGYVALKRQGKLSLVEATKDDITTMQVQEHDHFNFKTNDATAPMASGPTDRERASRSRKAQMEATKQVAEMLRIPEVADAGLDEVRNPSVFMPKPSAQHKSRSKGPVEKRRKKHVSTTNFFQSLN